MPPSDLEVHGLLVPAQVVSFLEPRVLERSFQLRVDEREASLRGGEAAHGLDDGAHELHDLVREAFKGEREAHRGVADAEAKPRDGGIVRGALVEQVHHSLVEKLGENGVHGAAVREGAVHLGADRGPRGQEATVLVEPHAKTVIVHKKLGGEIHFVLFLGSGKDGKIGRNEPGKKKKKKAISYIHVHMNR